MLLSTFYGLCLTCHERNVPAASTSSWHTHPYAHPHTHILPPQQPLSSSPSILFYLNEINGLEVLDDLPHPPANINYKSLAQGIMSPVSNDNRHDECVRGSTSHYLVPKQECRHVSLCSAKTRQQRGCWAMRYCRHFSRSRDILMVKGLQHASSLWHFKQLLILTSYKLNRMYRSILKQVVSAIIWLSI